MRPKPDAPFPTGVGHMDAIGLRNGRAPAALLARHGQVERVPHAVFVEDFDRPYPFLA